MRGLVGNPSAQSAFAGAAPATVPAAPTIGVATAGDGQAVVTFTRNGDGGSAVIDSRITSTPGGITADVASSPGVITGLTNGVEYTFKVKDRNAVGYSAESAASNAVTPSGAAWTLALTGTTYADSYDYLTDPAPGGLRRFTASDAQNLDGPPWLEDGGFTNNYTFASGATLSVGAATTKALVKEIAICSWNGGTEASGPLFDPTGFTGMTHFNQWSSMTGSWPASWAAWPATLVTFDVGDFGQTTGLSGSMPTFVGAPFADTLTYLGIGGKNCPATLDIRGLTALETLGFASDNITAFVATGNSAFGIGVCVGPSEIPGSANLLNFDINGTGATTTAVLNLILVQLDALGLSGGVIDIRVSGGTTIDGSAGGNNGTAAKAALEGRGYTVHINP